MWEWECEGETTEQQRIPKALKRLLFGICDSLSAQCTYIFVPYLYKYIYSHTILLLYWLGGCISFFVVHKIVWKHIKSGRRNKYEQCRCFFLSLSPLLRLSLCNHHLFGSLFSLFSLPTMTATAATAAPATIKTGATIASMVLLPTLPSTTPPPSILPLPPKTYKIHCTHLSADKLNK